MCHPLGLVLKTVSKIKYCNNIGVITGTFDFAHRLNCTDFWTGLF